MKIFALERWNAPVPRLRAGVTENNDICMAVAQVIPVLDVERCSGTSAAGRSTRSSTSIRAAAGGGRR